MRDYRKEHSKQGQQQYWSRVGMSLAYREPAENESCREAASGEE
jgi:hypothetical protein